jgi:hypothetical protein
VGTLLKLNPDAITADTVEPDIIRALTKQSEFAHAALSAERELIAVRSEAGILREEVIRLQAALEAKTKALTSIGKLTSDKQVRDVVKNNVNRLDELEAYCREFIDVHRITSADKIHQSDSLAEHATEFLQAVCDIIGYAKAKKE